MFYFYGAKHQLARQYPKPEHSLIVEPFAGAAGYSCYWAEQEPYTHEFLLIEKDIRVVQAWNHLLDGGEMPQCPPVDAYTDEFLVMVAAASNAIGKLKRLKVTPRVVKVYGGMVRRIDRVLPYMVNRTTVLHQSYEAADTLTATWFIDPPYQPPKRLENKTAHPRGMGYAPGCTSAEINYDHLSHWVRSLKGQVIACEQAGANWLDFRFLTRHGNSQGTKSSEMIWTNS